jgi:hypothetical protein
MRLIIQLENGAPLEHPIVEENFIQSFPDIDLNALPEQFAFFVRKPLPKLGVYEVYTNTTYEQEGDVFVDVHHTRLMTEQERLEKQNRIKADWAEMQGSASWTFNPDICNFVPPVPRPNDGNFYRWDEDSLSWLKIY